MLQIISSVGNFCGFVILNSSEESMFNPDKNRYYWQRRMSTFVDVEITELSRQSTEYHCEESERRKADEAILT